MEGVEMAGKADFTEQEWETLQKGVTGSAMWVSLADRSFFDTFKEVGAMSKYLSQAREKSASPLIRELAEVRGTGFGLTTNPDELEQGTTEALRSGIATLQTKAPDEIDAYRAFVIEVATAVGDAAKDIGAKETGAIERIKAALPAEGGAAPTEAAPAPPASPSPGES
jgi:phytoene/squalene synthetase